MANSIIVNDVAYDFQNGSFTLAGQAFALQGINKIKYEARVAGIENVYGAGREPLSVTQGRNEYGDVEIELWKSAFDSLIVTLGGWDVARTPAATFDLSVTFSYDGGPTTVTTLQGLRYSKHAPQYQQAQKLVVPVTFHCFKVIEGA